jgi:hypothetical protein
VVLLLFVIGSTVVTAFQLAEPWALRALVEIPVMSLGKTAAGSVAAWLIGLLAIAGAYALVNRQFARMEIPTEPSRYTLLRPSES